MPSTTRPGGARRHVDVCLRCQVAATRQRRLSRDLRSLRDVVEPAPPGLLSAVMASLALAPERKRTRNPWARRLATGSAIAAAAGTVGAVVVASRRGHAVS
jgi:hypothetical protein